MHRFDGRDFLKKQTFIICDREWDYVCNLMEYMTARPNFPFDVQAFGDREALKQYLSSNTAEMMLIAPGMLDEEITHLSVERIMLLSGGGEKEYKAGFPMVYKYQPSNRLMAEVMEYYADQTSAQTQWIPGKNVEIIGVYSPLGRCGKTCFALTLGQILAEKRTVLCLNLEGCAGFERLLGKTYESDLADVMYFIRQNRGNILFKLNAAVQRLGKLDYVPPVFSRGDLKEVRTEEWGRLLEQVTMTGGYDTVILDIAEAAEEPYALLLQCTKIYTPILPDVISEAKVEHYETQLKRMEYEDILKKTTYVKLPFCEPEGNGDYYMEQLAQGDMGTFVRTLLREGGKTDEWRMDGI